jgi:tRNA nucleotidyltransferase (CCA-adding enzyme)
VGVIGSAVAAGNEMAIIVLETTSARLPKVLVRRGPPAGIDRTGEFLAKWTRKDAEVLQGPFVTTEGHLSVELRRSQVELVPLLLQALPGLTLGKDLQSLSLKAKITDLSEVTSKPELELALGELLGKRVPWLNWSDR